ncbi:hypothetical protein VUR80DRAFT_6524 [Thermomyces stellatus]
MYLQQEEESLAGFCSDDEEHPLLPEPAVPPPSPESGEVPSGKLPSFDDGLMGSRAWIKLVLWAYHLTPSEITAFSVRNETLSLTDSPSLFRVTFPEIILRNAFPRRLPLTSPINLYGVKSFLIRVKSKHDDPNHTNWAENEVAGMHIARHVLRRLSPCGAHLIPDVYAWHSEERDPGSGCIIMQDIPGEPLSKS